jgi:hypothetical protein
VILIDETIFAGLTTQRDAVMANVEQGSAAYNDHRKAR